MKDFKQGADGRKGRHHSQRRSDREICKSERERQGQHIIEKGFVDVY